MRVEPRVVVPQGDSAYLLAKWIDHVTGTAAYTPPANLYVLFADSTMTEVAAGTKNYARVLVNPWIDPSPPSLFRCNRDAFNFGVQSCAWDFTRTDCWLGLADALTAGNILTTTIINDPTVSPGLKNVGGTGKQMRWDAQMLQYRGHPSGYDPTFQQAGFMTRPYERKWLDHLFGIAPWTVGTTQIALASTDMLTGVISYEVTDAAYSRQATPTFAAAAPVVGSPSNEVRAESTADVVFGSVTDPRGGSYDPQVLLIDQAANLAIIDWAMLDRNRWSPWPGVPPFTIPAGKLALNGFAG